MSCVLKYTLIALLTPILLLTVVFWVLVSKQIFVIKELDEIATRNPAELITYFRTKVDKNNVEAAMNWLQGKAETTTDFIIPLIYSDMVASSAKENQKTISPQKYIDMMTTASTMYVFADATMSADYRRCKDQTAQAGITAIRAARFHPIYVFLTTQAEISVREKIFKDGFALEERIASRPPNEGACAHGLGAYGGREVEYIPLDEWNALRATTIANLKKSFTEKFLAHENTTPPNNAHQPLP